MRDNLCVNQVNYADLLAARNEICEELEELDGFYADKLNACASDLQNLYSKLNLLEQGLVNHNKKWAEQVIINEEQLDVKYRLEGQEVCMFNNEKDKKELNKKIEELQKQVLSQNIIITTLLCAIPLYVLYKKLF